MNKKLRKTLIIILVVIVACGAVWGILTLVRSLNRKPVGVYAMTDIQMQLFAARLDEDLLEDLEHWQEALELAVKANDTEVQKKAEKQIAKIRTALEF